MTSCQDVVVIEARQVDKSRQKLLGGVLQNTDLCWQAFLSFPPPSPLAPFFHSFPFLARQNYQNFLCSENPQKRLLRRLQNTPPSQFRLTHRNSIRKVDLFLFVETGRAQWAAVDKPIVFVQIIGKKLVQAT